MWPTLVKLLAVRNVLRVTPSAVALALLLLVAVHPSARAVADRFCVSLSNNDSLLTQ